MYTAQSKANRTKEKFPVKLRSCTTIIKPNMIKFTEAYIQRCFDLLMNKYRSRQEETGASDMSVTKFYYLLLFLFLQNCCHDPEVFFGHSCCLSTSRIVVMIMILFKILIMTTILEVFFWSILLFKYLQDGSHHCHPGGFFLVTLAA